MTGRANVDLRSYISVLGDRNLHWRCFKPRRSYYIDKNIHLSNYGKETLCFNMCKIICDVLHINYRSLKLSSNAKQLDEVQ